MIKNIKKDDKVVLINPFKDESRRYCFQTLSVIEQKLHEVIVMNKKGKKILCLKEDLCLAPEMTTKFKIYQKVLNVIPQESISSSAPFCIHVIKDIRKKMNLYDENNTTIYGTGYYTNKGWWHLAINLVPFIKIDNKVIINNSCIIEKNDFEKRFKSLPD